MLKDYYNKFFKKAFTARGADRLKYEPMPYRDWRIVVTIFFVALSISIGFNVYMLFQINNDSFFVASVQKRGESVLNKDGLARVLTDLAAKEAVLSGKSATTVSAVDPSR